MNVEYVRFKDTPNLAHQLHNWSQRHGAISCAFHAYITDTTCVPVRPIHKPTVFNGRAYRGLLIALVGIPEEHPNVIKFLERHNGLQSVPESTPPVP